MDVGREHTAIYILYPLLCSVYTVCTMGKRYFGAFNQQSINNRVPEYTMYLCIDMVSKLGTGKPFHLSLLCNEARHKFVECVCVRERERAMYIITGSARSKSNQLIESCHIPTAGLSINWI
jgi:hypothetical protein